MASPLLRLRIPPTPEQEEACDCFNKQGASPELFEGTIDGPDENHWGRLHIALEHGYGMNQRKGQFRLGLTARTPLMQLLDEGLLRARGAGVLWQPRPDRNTPSLIYCVLDTDSGTEVGTSSRGKRTNNFRIVADTSPPYRVITMFPR